MLALLPTTLGVGTAVLWLRAGVGDAPTTDEPDVGGLPRMIACGSRMYGPLATCARDSLETTEKTVMEIADVAPRPRDN
jgi:hypothetical protein